MDNPQRIQIETKLCAFEGKIDQSCTIKNTIPVSPCEFFKKN